MDLDGMPFRPGLYMFGADDTISRKRWFGIVARFSELIGQRALVMRGSIVFIPKDTTITRRVGERTSWNMNIATRITKEDLTKMQKGGKITSAITNLFDFNFKS